MDHNRFGVVISKKVDKSAAERNRLKRIILDSTKKFILPAGAGTKRDKYGILIIVSPAVSKIEKADIIKELDDFLSKTLNH